MSPSTGARDTPQLVKLTEPDQQKPGALTLAGATKLFSASITEATNE